MISQAKTLIGYFSILGVLLLIVIIWPLPVVRYLIARDLVAVGLLLGCLYSSRIITRVNAPALSTPRKVKWAEAERQDFRTFVARYRSAVPRDRSGRRHAFIRWLYYQFIINSIIIVSLVSVFLAVFVTIGMTGEGYVSRFGHTLGPHPFLARLQLFIFGLAVASFYLIVVLLVCYWGWKKHYRFTADYFWCDLFTDRLVLATWHAEEPVMNEVPLAAIARVHPFKRDLSSWRAASIFGRRKRYHTQLQCHIDSRPESVWVLRLKAPIPIAYQSSFRLRVRRYERRSIIISLDRPGEFLDQLGRLRRGEEPMYVVEPLSS